ncbi:hypothetical protein JCM30471_02810 [Desulfuromonas carbonis]
MPPDFKPAVDLPLPNLPSPPQRPQAPTLDGGEGKEYKTASKAVRPAPILEQRQGTNSPSTATAPQAASNPPPAYPRQAREQGWAGSVWLQIRIGSSGGVETVHLEQSSGYPLLDEAAIEAVRNWKFEPARQAGQAIATTVRVPIRFRLDND